MIHLAAACLYSLTYELHAPIDVVDAVNQLRTKESVMKKFLFASTAAVLMSGSLAYADHPLIPNDNDHMEALSTAMERNAAARSYGAQIVASTFQDGVATSMAAAQPVSPGFLLHSDGNDQKQVENQYAR